MELEIRLSRLPEWSGGSGQFGTPHDRLTSGDLMVQTATAPQAASSAVTRW